LLQQWDGSRITGVDRPVWELPGSEGVRICDEVSSIILHRKRAKARENEEW
jgi:hypothetical protein